MQINKIGDTHLGKKFEVGVPLHRRGDRERMQMAQFRSELMAGGDFNIQMGDIFDRMVVPYAVIMETAEAYRAARAVNPRTTYALLRGNHDASRDVERVTAFDLLTAILRPMGVFVAKDSPIYLNLPWPREGREGEVGQHILVPWHPVITAVEMIQQHGSAAWDDATVYGHWDVVMGDENQIPAAALKELGVKRAYTGHDHNAREMEIAGLPITVVGSMQPYSHAEDPDGHLYVTVSLTEALTTDLRDKCVRVVLAPNEVLDQQIDCLQLTIQKQREEIDMGPVDFEAFDLGKLFNEAREQVGLEEEFGQTIFARLEDERAARA